jgi:hypothetical protein
MRHIKSLFILCLISFLAACGGGGGGDVVDSVTGGGTAPARTPIQTPEFHQTYEGRTDSVIASVSLPAGLYKLTATTSNYIIVHEVTTSAYLLNLSSGEASDGAEALFHAPIDGSYTFEVSNIGAPWTISIDNMDLNNPAPITEIGNVTARGPKVLGPYSVETSGYYLFTLLCNSYFIMTGYSPYTGDRVESIYNVSRGNYGAQATGAFYEDMVLFHTHNMSETWSVTAQKL